ncbi:MAG: TRAP transporter small permease [Gammaproteobacteria bacterium]|nr:TRAP transporter small permease [Gammaproteobacteria bacterium]MCP5135555.1 TRAP transporter small permease [Gammaproteobacteria bacterium]
MILKLLNKMEEAVIGLLLAAITLLVFVEVVMRFGFNTGISWVQEATLLMSAWFVLFGVSYGLKVGAHINVDAVVRRLPGVAQRVAAVVAVMLSLIYCGLFLYGSWIYLAKMNLIGIELEDIPVPAWIAHSILIIGLGMLALRLLILLWTVARGRAEGFPHGREVEESVRLAEEAAAGDKS